MNIPGSTAWGKDGEGSPGWLPWLVLALAVSASFALGMLAGREAATENASEDRFWIEQLPPEAVVEPGGQGSSSSAVSGNEGAAAVGNAVPATGTYVASKSGTKYYLPTCSGAKRIKEENRVWFDTKADAEAAGYGPATGCPGL